MSFEIKRVLLPTDFSEASKKALPFALEIAHVHKAELTLMHTIELHYDFAPMIEEYQQKMEKGVKRLLDETITKIQKNDRYKHLKIKTSTQFGPTVFSIMEEIEDSEIDFLVMGTTGATGLNKVLFGSNTTEIIQRAKIPVLAIPENSTFQGFKHIIFLTHYRDGDLQALEKTVAFAKKFNSKVSVLHIAPDLNLKEEIMHRGFKEIASKRIPYKKLSFELLVEADLISGISEFGQLQSHTLLTLVKYEKPFFTRLFYKDHSKQMGFYTEHPLLILNGESPY